MALQSIDKYRFHLEYLEDQNPILKELQQKIEDIATLVNEIKADFNAHTHNADGGQAGSYFTSPPRSDEATVTEGTPLEVTSPDITT